MDVVRVLVSKQTLSDFFQIGISVSTVMVTGLPEVMMHMKVPTIKHVESFCNLPLEGFLAPLSYNLLLILLCAIYAFLTRRLPENYNESWYIFVSVSTATFLWVVFLPTYFNVYHAYHQAALLAFCLLLNASITGLSLFVPKAYAIYYVSEDRISTFSFNDMNDTENSASSVSSGMSNIDLNVPN